MAGEIDLCHGRKQSGLKAVIAWVERLDFASTRDHLQVSDSVLSRQAAALEAAGMLTITKGYVGKRPRTWYSHSPQGRKAWQQHLDALRAIADAGTPAGEDR